MCLVDKSSGCYLQWGFIPLGCNCCRAEIQTLRSSQHAVEELLSLSAGSLENSRDAERACAASVKTEQSQHCTYQAYPAENLLAIHKKLLEVHFEHWQNSQTAS